MDPKTYPVGSQSRWDTIHFTPLSVNGIEEQGYFLKVGWDHRLVIKCCPLTLWFWIIAVKSGFLFCCKMVRWRSESQICFFFWSAKEMWSFLLTCIFYSILYRVRTKKRWFIKVLNWWYNQILGENGATKVFIFKHRLICLFAVCW